MNAKRGVGLALLIVVLAGVGCAGPQRERLQAAQGMSTELDAATVIQSTEAQGELLKALVQRANLKDQTKLPPNESSDWYEVAEAGFGFIDEQCEKYLDAMFWYNRYQTSLQRQISVTGAVTASVMGILDASATAIALTAAAFGLTAASVDNYSSQILFDLEPSGVKSLVDRSRAQYRNAAASKTRMERINTRPRAMSLMQAYLSLCLPATIETQVNGAVAETGFTQDTTTSDSIVPILRRVGGTELQANAQRSKSDAEKALEAELKKLVTKFEPPQPVPTGITNPRTDAERNLSRMDGSALQKALCVKEDGNFGTETRKAIKLFQAAESYKKTGEVLPEDQRTDQLEAADISKLKDAPESCEDSEFAYDNVFEKFLYDSEKIKQLQETLELELTKRSGVFDPATRDAIEKVQKELQKEDEEKWKDLPPKVITPELAPELL